MIGAKEVLPLVALASVGQSRLGQFGSHSFEGARFEAKIKPGRSEGLLERFVPGFTRPSGQEVAPELFSLDFLGEVLEFLLSSSGGKKASGN